MRMGYSLIYGLINFAILAAALYYIGKKIVPKIFDGHRDQIREALQASDEAAENAKTLLAGMEATNAAAQQECAEILQNAEKTVRFRPFLTFPRT